MIMVKTNKRLSGMSQNSFISVIKLNSDEIEYFNDFKLNRNVVSFFYLNMFREILNMNYIFIILSNTYYNDSFNLY